MSLIGKRRAGTNAPAPSAPGPGGGVPAGSPHLLKMYSAKNILNVEQIDAANTPEMASIRKEVDASTKELIKETKLSFMERGEFFYFNKHLNHFRLPKMRRYIEYCEAKSASELLTEVKKRIPVESIQSVVMVGGLGNDSPQAKKKAKGSIAERRPTHSDTFVFSISYKTESGQEERCDLQTSNKRSFVDWFDGLRMLTGAEPELPETLEELEVLRTVALECRLIEEESKGAQSLSLDVPPIPTAPADYNFYYK